MSAARATAVTAALAMLASAPAFAQDGGRCQGALPLPASPAKVHERALLDAACGKECVLECPRNQEPGQDEEAPLELVAHYEGSFRCPGRLESIVSLFPCGDAMGMHGIAGTVRLMRATSPAGRAKGGPRWERAGEVENGVLNGRCQVARAGQRDALVCMSGWGPMQGITGESLCVLGGAAEFAMTCPLRVQDSCGADPDKGFSATVESWSVGEPAADGTIPLRAKIKRAGCDGKGVRNLEAVVLLDASGARLAPQTVELFKKVDVGQE